ncbi:hypothetical protein OID55_10865 [Streptomyces sp. NBC_00715]
MLTILVILVALIFVEGAIALIQARLIVNLLHRVETLEKRPQT